MVPVSAKLASARLRRCCQRAWQRAVPDGRRYVPDHYQRLLRVEEACFTASDLFGSACPGQGEPCAHCGGEEVCGAIDACGQYDLGQAWLQVAAEFCGPGIGEHAGTVTIHQVELVEPQCE